VSYLGTSVVMIHHGEALYQVYVPLPFITRINTVFIFHDINVKDLDTQTQTDRQTDRQRERDRERESITCWKSFCLRKPMALSMSRL